MHCIGSNISSYSEAQVDHKAIRYLTNSEVLIIPLSVSTFSVVPCENYPIGLPVGGNTTGMSMPVSGSTTGIDTPVSGGTTAVGGATTPGGVYQGICYNITGVFDGFRLYKIDATNGITEYFSIVHASGDLKSGGCWSGSSLQPRSLVFHGDIMTLKGHSILSHNLTSQKQNAAPINLDDGVAVCKPYFL